MSRNMQGSYRGKSTDWRSLRDMRDVLGRKRNTDENDRDNHDRDHETMKDTYTESDFVLPEGSSVLLAVTVTYETETGEIVGTDFKPVCNVGNK